MRLRRSALAAVTASLVVLTCLAAPGPAAADEPAGPEFRSFVSAFAYSLAHPDAETPGANDWSCAPSEAHPDPVILVHGTVENRYVNWAEFAPRLKRQGYCVYALSYGGHAGTPFRGMTDIAASAGELSAFVDRVLASTGAEDVDIVGHSQGGMMPRYYLKYLGGDEKVDQLIALSPSNYGTVFWGVLPAIHALPGGDALLNVATQAFEQQRKGSDFLTDLNAGGDTRPGVRYVVIQTVFDEVVMPYGNAFLKGPGVKNILLQSLCLLDHTDHLGIAYDPIALQLVENELDPSTAKQPRCQYVPPVVS